MNETLSTPQEKFWAGDFGNEYAERNRGDDLLAANLHFFSAALRQAVPPKSAVELGANIGMNVRALKLLYPGVRIDAVEINAAAVSELGEHADRAHHSSIFDWEPVTADLSYIRGVLIHLNPEKLPVAYDRLYRASNRYILVNEYYSIRPQQIPYRGHAERMYSRDYAGEMMDAYPDLRLVDYGFLYSRDPRSLGDESSWFLMEKAG